MLESPSPPTELANALPSGLALGHRALTPDCVAELLPEERPLLEDKRSSKRRMEIAAGRVAAREALLRAGCAAAPILMGRGREPLWPHGFLGSITHKEDLALAIAAPRDRWRAVGLDLESMARATTVDITARVCVASEARWVSDAPTLEDRDLRLRSLFSAKESLFKALYPLEGVWFGYEDAELTPTEGGFAATLRKSVAAEFPKGAEVDLGMTRRDAWILTWTAIGR